MLSLIWCGISLNGCSPRPKRSSLTEHYENSPSVGNVHCVWCGMTRGGKRLIDYTPLLDATPESELDALAAVYAFVLECHERRKVADATGDPNEVKENDDVDPAGSLP